MNYWLVGAGALMLTLAPCLFACCRGNLMRRLVALQLGGNLSGLLLVLLAEGFGRASYMDVALLAVILSATGSFVFIRLFERWF